MMITMRDEKTLAVRIPYHPDAVEGLKRLGGRWNDSTGEWTLDARDRERVLELLREIFGHAPGDPPPELVTVVLAEKFMDRVAGHKDLFVLGRCVASRRGRDYPVRLGDGVIIRTGGFHERGGSMKYPQLAPKPGTSLEVRDVPRSLAEQLRARFPDGIEIIGETHQPEQDEVERLVEQARLLTPEQRRLLIEKLGKI